MKKINYGFSFIEIMIVFAIMFVIMMYAFTIFESGRHARCMNTHLKLWKSLILQARTEALLNRNIVYVKIEAGDDNVPYIVGIKDSAKSLYTPATRYLTAIGDSTNLASGETAPCTTNLKGIRLVSILDMPSLPPDLDDASGNGLPEFQDNIFGISPTGIVLDRNNRPFSGAFYFTYSNYENGVNVPRAYASIYVTASGAIQTYYLENGLGATDADNWARVQ